MVIYSAPSLKHIKIGLIVEYLTMVLKELGVIWIRSSTNILILQPHQKNSDCLVVEIF